MVDFGIKDCPKKHVRNDITSQRNNTAQNNGNEWCKLQTIPLPESFVQKLVHTAGIQPKMSLCKNPYLARREARASARFYD